MRLGEITSKITDGSHNPPPNNLSGVPILSATNIFDEKIQIESASRWISEEQWEIENKRTDIQLNDILLTIVGTIGRTAIVKSNDKFALQRSVAVLKPIQVYSEYISYVLQSAFLLDLLNLSSKGTAQKGIYLSSLKDLILPLPALNEQHRIVAKIEELLPFIEQYDQKERQLTALNKNFPEQLKKSILQAAIQGKLTEQLPTDEPASELLKRIQAEKARLISEKKVKKPKHSSEIIVRDNLAYEIKAGVERCIADEIPFDIPESWCWVRLGDIGEWGSGATPNRHEPKFYENGTIPWLKTGDLNDNYIDEIPEYITTLAVEKTSVKLNPIGSVLIAMYGATIGKLGILNIEATTNQACCACVPDNGIFNKYLFYYLMSQKSEFQKRSEGSGQPNISKEKIVSYLFPLPPLEEQYRIVAKIEQLLSNLQKLE